MHTLTILSSLFLAACGIFMGAARAEPAGADKPAPKHLSREACAKDAKQLVRLLELSHPDPYSPLGGKVAFKRIARARLESLPAKGMESSELADLLQGFLARLGDGHTRLLLDRFSSQMPKDSLPLLFGTSDKGIFVLGTDLEALNKTVGFRLRGIDGHPVAEIESRLAQTSPFENAYHALAMLRRAAVSPEMLRRLLPGLDPKKGIAYDLESPTGERTTRRVIPGDAANARPEKWRSPPRRFDALVRSDEPFYHRFLDRESIAYFRVATVMGREAFEMAYRYKWGDPTEMLARFYQRAGRPMPAGIEKALEGVPSFFNASEKLLEQMKRRGTRTLIVDLRGNGGGATPTVVPFLYQLYGDAYFAHRFPAEFVTVFSQLYLDKMKTSLEALRKKHVDLSIQLGDYRFEDEKRESALVKRERQLREYREKGMSFAARLDRLRGKPLYKPRTVVVLCDDGTYSAAFHFMYFLRDLGAAVVGVPSSQSPNAPMEMTEFKLDESGLRGSISNSAQIFTPEDPQAKVLQPDFPMSYELFQKYGFEEEGSLRYALDLIAKGKISSGPFRRKAAGPRLPSPVVK